MMRSRYCNGIKPQQGLSLLLVLVLLVITVSVSLNFHQRLFTSTRISGATRDNSESLLLAESAMEMLRGGFINQLCSITDCTANGSDGKPLGWDFQRAGSAVAKNMKNPTVLDTNLIAKSVSYIFYVGAADQLLPGILQRVANQGAGVGGPACGPIADNSFAITAANCKQDIDALFGGAHSPILYTTNANGLLINSTASNWQAELDRTDNNTTVAAAWLEITISGDDPDAIDLWVQASAQAGMARSYVQRYIGTYPAPSNLLGNDLAGISEASNIDREVSP